MEITKALLSHILINQLGISVETYNQMDIKQQSINERYIIIVQFLNPAHVMECQHISDEVNLIINYMQERKKIKQNGTNAKHIILVMILRNLK
jgi:hypothetical protein